MTRLNCFILLAFCFPLFATEAHAYTMRTLCEDAGGVYKAPPSPGVPPDCVCDEGTKHMQGKSLLPYWTGHSFMSHCFVTSCSDTPHSVGKWSAYGRSADMFGATPKCEKDVDMHKASIGEMCKKYCGDCSRQLQITLTKPCTAGSYIETDKFEGYESFALATYECSCVN